MNKLEIFNYENSNIRTVVKNGDPWFVAADVCAVLEIGNPSDPIRRLDEDEKGVDLIETLGGVQNMVTVNESGLYMLIMGSRKPQAKAFKRWVTHEVLPAIRKHGVYAVDEVLNNPDVLISALTALKQERADRKRLELEAAIARQQIAELKPKASYYDEVLSCKDLIKISHIAKDYGMSAIAFNRLLKEKGVQFKQGDTWLLYQKYADKGYTNSKTYTYQDHNGTEHSKLHTLWTQAGRLFLYHHLKEYGILPMMERE